jgi:hypothetical protein
MPMTTSIGSEILATRLGMIGFNFFIEIIP